MPLLPTVLYLVLDELVITPRFPLPPFSLASSSARLSSSPLARVVPSFLSPPPPLSFLQTLFSFEADATSLVPDMFSLGFEDEYEELEADLQEFSEKFADSPAAQVS